VWEELSPRFPHKKGLKQRVVKVAKDVFFSQLRKGNIFKIELKKDIEKQIFGLYSSASEQVLTSPFASSSCFFLEHIVMLFILVQHYIP